MERPAKSVHRVKAFLAASLCLLVLFAADIRALSAEEKATVKPTPNYFVLRAGPGWVNEIKQNAASRPGADLQPSSEYAVNFAYGHRFLNWLRVELELGYIDYEINEMILKGRGQTASVVGSDSQFNGMLNAYAEWNNETSFTPFIGGGIGLTRTKLDLTFLRPGTGTWVTTKNTDYPMAYQFLAGVGWAFHPSWELELMYRYYGTNDRVRDNPGGTFPKQDVEGIRSSFIELGLRYNF